MVRVEFLSRKINLALWRSLTCGLITIWILVISLLMSPTLSAIAQPTASPTPSPTAPPTASPSGTPRTCKIGAFLISLYDFNLANKSFSADFWLWSSCPTEDLQPLKALDFVNAKDLKTSLDASFKRQNGYWSYVKVSGAFRYDWNVRNFPFDRHVLQIIMENTAGVVSKFIYTPDKIGSKYSENIKLESWRITDFTVMEKTHEYATTFGDPDLPDGTSKFTRLYILISLARDSAISFLKISSPVYIAFAISLLAYFLDTATGVSLIAGTLFAVVVNQQVSESVLGSAENMTLVDMIHITAMIYILATSVVIVYSYVKSGADPQQLPIRSHRQIFNITWISYVVGNIIIVAMAAGAG